MSDLFPSLRRQLPQTLPNKWKNACLTGEWPSRRLSRLCREESREQKFRLAAGLTERISRGPRHFRKASFRCILCEPTLILREQPPLQLTERWALRSGSIKEIYWKRLK